MAPATYWAIGGMPHPWTTRFDEVLIGELFSAIFEQMNHVGFKVAIALTGHYGPEQMYTLKKSACDFMYRSSMLVAPLPEYEVAWEKGYLSPAESTSPNVEVGVWRGREGLMVFVVNHLDQASASTVTVNLSGEGKYIVQDFFSKEVCRSCQNDGKITFKVDLTNFQGKAYIVKKISRSTLFPKKME